MLVFLLLTAMFGGVLLSSAPRVSRGIFNDFKMLVLDPALESPFEVLFAYPGFWALFWYRLSHALWKRQIPIVSVLVPRLVMSLVRYATAVDIHPAAQISEEGVLLDHASGTVIGATAIVGGKVTLYHQVTLGSSGKPLPKGAKRHPTVGDRVVVGAGAKILGDIYVGDDVLVGANSVVTKSVPARHTAIGIPARILCKGKGLMRDVSGAAICELHRRLSQVELEFPQNSAGSPLRKEDLTPHVVEDIAAKRHVPTTEVPPKIGDEKAPGSLPRPAAMISTSEVVKAIDSYPTDGEGKVEGVKLGLGKVGWTDGAVGEIMYSISRLGEESRTGRTVMP